MEYHRLSLLMSPNALWSNKLISGPPDSPELLEYLPSASGANLPLEYKNQLPIGYLEYVPSAWILEYRSAFI